MKLVRVGGVLRLQRRQVEIDPLEEYRLIGVFSFGRGIFHRDPMFGAELGDYRFFRVEPGDLVLSNIQAWEGAIAYAGSADRGAIGTHRFLTYTPIDDRVDTNWARWFFLSEPGMELIRRAAPGTTVRNRTLAIERFENLEIPLPPIAEQRRVAGGLDRLAERSTQLAGLRQRASVLRQGTIGGLVAAVCRDARRTRFGDVFRLVRRDVDVDLAATYIEIGIRSFGRGIFHKTAVSAAELGRKRVFYVEPGDLVISNVFAWEGAVALAGEADAGLVGSHRFMTWVPRDSSVRADWMALYLTSPAGLEGLQRASPGSAGRNRTLAVSRLNAVEVEIPPLSQQNEVAREASVLRAAAALSANGGEIEHALPAAALNRAFADFM